MDSSDSTVWLRMFGVRGLQRALLLVGSPALIGSCTLASSSCPDNGAEPPLVQSKPVDPTFADGGPLDAAQCDQVCNQEKWGLVTCFRESADSVVCVTHPPPCEGRRPVGLRWAERTETSGFLLHLADAAWLEAASVDAFRVVRRELRAHGAPRRLLRAASRSKRDERRHARVTRALARRFGARVPSVERDESPPRSLEAFAIDNAVEGCVRETWGALIALRQATRASEPSVRAELRRIARDETRHAELAWAIDRWLGPRLSTAQRRRVREARISAVAELAREVRVALPAAERERLGLPGSEEAGALLAELDRSLALTGSGRSGADGFRSRPAPGAGSDCPDTP